MVKKREKGVSNDGTFSSTNDKCSDSNCFVYVASFYLVVCDSKKEKFISRLDRL